MMNMVDILGIIHILIKRITIDITHIIDIMIITNLDQITIIDIDGLIQIIIHFTIHTHIINFTLMINMIVINVQRV